MKEEIIDMINEFKNDKKIFSMWNFVWIWACLIRICVSVDSICELMKGRGYIMICGAIPYSSFKESTDYQ